MAVDVGMSLIKKLVDNCDEYKKLQSNPPRLIQLDNLPRPEPEYIVVRNNLNLHDEPLVVEAMIKTILESTDQSVLDLLTDLYVFAKMRFDGSEPHLYQAEQTMRRIREHNIQIEKSNADSVEVFNSNLTSLSSQQETYQALLANWWDTEVDRLNQMVADSKGPYKGIIQTAAKDIANKFPNVFPKNPLQCKYVDCGDSFSCTSPGEFAQVVEHFIQRLKSGIKTWQNNQAEKLRKQIEREFPFSHFEPMWHSRSYYDPYDQYEKSEYDDQWHEQLRYRYRNEQQERDKYDREIDRAVRFEIEELIRKDVEGWTDVF